MKTSMKNKLHTIIRRSQSISIILLCVLAMLNSSIMTSRADVPDTTSVRTEQFFTTNDNTVSNTFTYVFEAVDAGAPMPTGSVGDLYNFNMTGNGADHTFNISYSVQGIYHYKLYQKIPTIKPAHYTYDESVYDIVVYYTLDAATPTDRLSVTIQKVGGGKVIDPPFTNTYDDGSTEPTTEPETTTEPTTEPETTQPATTGGGNSGGGGGGTPVTTATEPSIETVPSLESNDGNSGTVEDIYSIAPDGKPYGTTWLQGLAKTGEGSIGFLLLYAAILINIVALIILLIRRRSEEDTK